MIKNNTRVAFLFTIFAFVFVCIWFRDGQLIAAGEDGLWLYNPERTLKLFSNIWSAKGLGTISVFTLPRVPVLGVSAILSAVFSSWIILALIFWFLTFSGAFGMYLLAKEILSEKDRGIHIIAGLFYFLNLYSQSQIWRRFSSHLMFFWSLLPLFLYLWIRWINTGKIKWLILLVISTAIFSFSFSSPALVVTAFSTVGIWSIVKISYYLRNKKTRELFGLLSRLFLGLLSFIVINIWWIYPYFVLADTSMSGLSDWESNFNSLRGVSTYFPTKQIGLLRQSYLFGPKQDIFGFYSNPIIYAINVVVFLLFAWGVLVSRKLKHWPYLAALAIVGWFVSKGTNPPFGYQIYKFMFSNIPQTMLFRNPYEKFGLVWLIPYSLFFSLGIYAMYKSKTTITKIVKVFLLVVSQILLVWPMWTGKLYPDDVHIVVPEYYQETNNFINNDVSHSRLLMLPMIAGDSVQYEWDGGNYHGVEPSEYLFDKHSISKISRSNIHADEKYNELRDKFLKDEEYLDILKEMNVKYLILHHDYAEKIARSEEIVELERKLNGSKEIEFLIKIGKLSIFEFLGNSDPKYIIVNGSNTPNINYEKLSNSSYRVSVTESSEPYTLIFKEAFHNRWRAKISDKEVNKHFMVYDYANGWQVDREGSYTIDINFDVWPK